MAHILAGILAASPELVPELVPELARDIELAIRQHEGTGCAPDATPGAMNDAQNKANTTGFNRWKRKQPEDGARR
ncbi:MAG TPA: hypothetical protein VE338_15825 [Ktedonobacterales bacterium]|jgi:hypothetical protein|nr:hypothetical protein [Ktedonobacterales bacterium]